MIGIQKMGFFALAALLLLAVPAHAVADSNEAREQANVDVLANPTIHCPSTGICDLEGGFFPGGTIRVDVDAIGPDGISAWQLNVPGSPQGIYCKTQFREESGSQSWTCTIPAGNVTLHAFAPDEHQREYNLGLRW